MTVPIEKAVLALQLLIEGTSIRSTETITGLHRDTILRLLVVAGERCEKLLGRKIRNVPVKDVQCDEIWGDIFKKEGHKTTEEVATDNTIGDVYTFVAIERYTKLVLNFALGRRDQPTTDAFIEGLRAATAPKRFQLTTDGFGPYVLAIDATLDDRADYGMLVKQYNEDRSEEKRYSPAHCVGCKRRAVIDNPDPKYISTSHVERQNLTNANADPKAHPADQCVQQEMGKPLGGSRSCSTRLNDRMSLLQWKTFTLKDGTGEITVVTKRALPKVGTQLRVRGRVKDAFSIGSLQMVVLVEESDD